MFPVSDNFVPLRTAKRILGLSANTLRRQADQGKIRSRRTPAGHRLFEVGEPAGVKVFVRLPGLPDRQREKLAAGTGTSSALLQALQHEARTNGSLELVLAFHCPLQRPGLEMLRWLVQEQNAVLTLLPEPAAA